MAPSFEAAFPTIARWVSAYGWLEIGQDDYSRSFIRVLDEGGMVWEGEESYPTVDEALLAAEAGLVEWMAEEGLE